MMGNLPHFFYTEDTQLYFLTTYQTGGMWWHSWLSHSATSQKVTGLIPNRVNGHSTNLIIGHFIDLILLDAQ